MKFVSRKRNRRGRRNRGHLKMATRGRLTLWAIAGFFLFLGFFLLNPTSSTTVVTSLDEVFEETNEPLQEAAPLSAFEAELMKRLPVTLADYAAFSANQLLEQESSDPISESMEGYTIEYSFDRDLTRRVVRLLDRGRVSDGHIIVLDPQTGRVLAYVSTDSDSFPPQGSYPAASLVKIVTASAALGHDPKEARRPCLYRGNRYRLSRSSVHRPKSGHSVSLEHALASSNNRCFAQMAVDTLGDEVLLEALDRFGWTRSPGPGHSSGSIDRGASDYDLGLLGSGLANTRITPLHGAQLAASLVAGERLEPWWVDRILDSDQRELTLPARSEPERIMPSATAAEVREMLVRTTTHGTARSAFRDRRGRPRLGKIKVAGKTGNLTGNSPHGRYEWFVGLAPADDPTVAVAVLQLQSNLWWSKSSELAADLLNEIFCERKKCAAELADRFTGNLGGAVAPVLLSDPRVSP